MPSLSPTRKVRYTAADLNAIASAMTLLEFMGDFDKQIASGELSTGLGALRMAGAHIKKQREANGKPAAPKPETAK